MNGQKRWQRTSTTKPTVTRVAMAQLNSVIGSSMALLMGGLGTTAAIAATPTVPATPASPQSAAPPPVIAEMIQRLDVSASRKDLDATMKFYSSTFTHGDGLDFKTQEEALKLFWQTTPSIQYQTRLENWQAQGGNRYSLETTTTLRGVKKAADRDMDLTSTVRSRLVIADQKIISQEILSEQTRLTAGAKPPTVVISLPTQVNVGQTFSFDAVVKEPLGDDLLLGAAHEIPITSAQYLQPSSISLEPLSSGGLFKLGQAPAKPTRQWISAVLIKDGGMTIVSQRLNVVQPNPSTIPSPR